jgi:hypothetical protein
MAFVAVHANSNPAQSIRAAGRGKNPSQPIQIFSCTSQEEEQQMPTNCPCSFNQNTQLSSKDCQRSFLRGVREYEKPSKVPNVA